MKRVLVVGGYGGFGGRISRRLAAAGWEVVVGGRSEAKARAFCRERPNLIPLRIDPNADLAPVLASWRPFAVVDAAGPFQGATYALPRTCIAIGCHYLDIADGRDFVTRIGVLDEAARAARLAVISGASSVPGLSGAVVHDLARALDRVQAVEIAISASNRSTAGPSVTRAILSYVGHPIRLWRGQRWDTGHGWQDLRRVAFEVPGGPSLGPRLVALAEVPDLELLPERLPGRPAVTFRAGTELPVQNLAMWLLSWLVRWRWLRSLVPFGSTLIRLQRWLSPLGSDRSAMTVRVFGLSSGRRVERRWTLVASDGDGPEIPTLAVSILLDKLDSGDVPTGARDAGQLLRLSDFAGAFARLSVQAGAVEIQHPPSLYARVMGGRFDALPPAVRTMHGVFRDAAARGRAVVTRGRGLPARIVAATIGFPPEGEHALHVSFAEEDGIETWTRDFGGRRFRSRLSQQGTRLVERFGPLRFAFELPSEPRGLSMVMRRWWLGPIPLPLALAPRSVAREWDENGRFHFDVPISLPGLGLVVRYRGWLEPASGATADDVERPQGAGRQRSTPPAT